MGSVIGTHLHGPVLAKNPELADQLLAIATERAGVEYRPGERATTVDGYAAAARESQLAAARVAASAPDPLG